MLGALMSVIERIFPPALGSVDIEWFRQHAPSRHPLNMPDPFAHELTEDGAGPARPRPYRDGIDRTHRGL